MVNKGFRLGALGRSDDELAIYDNVVAEFSLATELALREQVARALMNKGATLGALGRSEDAIATYDNLLDRFITATEVDSARTGRPRPTEPGSQTWDICTATRTRLPPITFCFKCSARQRSRCCANKSRARSSTRASLLGVLGRGEDAVVTYDDFLAKHGDAKEPAVRELIASALLNKAVVLGSMGRNEDANGVCDDLLARFGAALEAPFAWSGRPRTLFQEASGQIVILGRPMERAFQAMQFNATVAGACDVCHALQFATRRCRQLVA